MTSDEFGKWFTAHCARFSGVDKMVERDPTISSDWLAALSGVSVEHAKQATRDMMAMDPQPFPTDHLGKIITLTKIMAYKPLSASSVRDYSGKPETYRCLDCRDRGAVEVYQPRAYEPIRNGSFSVEQHLRTIYVACKCDAGRQHTDKPLSKHGERVHRPMLKIDRNTMCVVEAVTIAEQVVEVTDFVLNHWKPSRHFSEFDAFSGKSKAISEVF